MIDLYKGRIVMDKITGIMYKVTWYDDKNIELYSEKLKSHERFTKEWFLDLFKVY